jgi:hypothetical protein
LASELALKVHQAVVSETETKEKREENTEGSSNEE